MNYRLVAKYLGQFTLATALLMLPALICAVCYREWTAFDAFVESMIIAAALAGALIFVGRKAPNQMF